MFEAVRVASGSSRAKPSVLVLGQFKGEGLSAADRKQFDTDGTLVAAAQRAEATGDIGSIAEAFPPQKAGRGKATRTIILGLGEKKQFSIDNLRLAAASLGRRLARTKDATVAVEFESPLKAVKADVHHAGSAFGEGLGLLAWNFTQFQGTGQTYPKRTKLAISSSTAGFRSGLERGLALAESANISRSLSVTPPNICTPFYMASQAQKMARQTGLKCTVLKGQQLEREKLEGLINVGKASANKPCLIRLEYTPTGKKKTAKPVVLLGKTMTYDTGGLSIKPTNFMAGMKHDKDGGCAVLGAMHAIATVIKPNRRVVGLLVAAENSISDEAYRPDDILTFRNGVTVEVTNTDAEGRLVLADGLCWACDKEDPACIINLATLTGGVVTALGSTFAGLWCDDDTLRGKVERAGAHSGERMWRLPHHQEYMEMMKSTIADIVNSNPNRKAHPIQGAAFLKYFVEDSVAWCHLDIAGVHAVEGECGPYVKNSPTGWGVRLLAELLDGA